MAATSNHWGDIATWIEKTIQTMDNRRQAPTIFNMITLLYNRMNSLNVDFNTKHLVIRNLRMRLDDRAEELYVKDIQQEII